MANRWFNQFKGSLERGVVSLDGYINLADDASVTSENILGASVAKATTGIYTITLEDSYPKLLSCSVTLWSLGTAAIAVKVLDAFDAAGTTVGSGMANVKSIKIATVTPATGAAVDTTVDVGISVHMVFKNSTV